jgi:transglutaminase-like putative cysteine protease
MKEKVLISSLISLIIFSFIKPIVVRAAEVDSYKTEYLTEYFPQKNGETEVVLTVKITQIRSDISIKQFTLSFPLSFPIDNVKVLSDKTVNPQMQKGKTNDLIFNLPEDGGGKNQQTIIKLEYVQKNSFNKNESLYEFISPTVFTKKNSVVSTVLHVPEFIKKKVSIVKPLPSKVDDGVIKWENVNVPTIYALFGESQSYKFSLLYHISNPSFSRKLVEIALPPETLYQKVYLESMSDEPESTYVDEDGNYIAVFMLNPHSEKKVSVEGVVRVFVKAQDDMMPYISQSFKSQQRYLLDKTPYWNLGKLAQTDVIRNLKSVEEIYNSVVSTLEYKYEKIEDKTRLGAKKALSDRLNAVCTEYADLFVALAREHGFYTREIEGYGFSSDLRLRPLSLVSDVLHAWVEYFDEKSQKWIPVDPTWQDTSKIDYFSSFDVNHIVFSIHGKSDSNPPAAGMYKIENTKDISITPVSASPQEDVKAELSTNIVSRAIKGKIYSGVVTIENRGNTFIKNKKITIESDSVSLQPHTFQVLLLAPLEKKQFSFTYFANGQKSKDQVNFFFENSQVLRKSITIKSFGLDITTSFLGVIAGALFLTIVIFIKLNKT